MNHKLTKVYINKRIIKICLKQGRIRWLNVEKKLKKLKKLKEEEEKDNFAFLKTPFLIFF